MTPEKKKSIWFAYLGILFLISGCGLVSPRGPVVGVQLYDETFSNNNSGWDHHADADGSTEYFEGGYQISISKDHYLAWANPGLDLENVIVKVDAKLINGSEDNSFGIVCRYQDSGNFYALVVSSDGYYAIRKRYQSGDLETISGDSFQISRHIHQGMMINQIAAECVGDRLRLFVNDRLLATVHDADLPSGDTGLIVGTFDASKTAVLFDNFVVYGAP